MITSPHFLYEGRGLTAPLPTTQRQRKKKAGNAAAACRGEPEKPQLETQERQGGGSRAMRRAMLPSKNVGDESWDTHLFLGVPYHLRPFPVSFRQAHKHVGSQPRARIQVVSQGCTPPLVQPLAGLLAQPKGRRDARPSIKQSLHHLLWLTPPEEHRHTPEPELWLRVWWRAPMPYCQLDM